jgi:hypothetical protein
MKSNCFYLALVFVLVLLVAVGCGSGDSPAMDSEPEAEEEVAEMSETEAEEEEEEVEEVEQEAEQAEGSILDGLADNRSAEICTSYMAYDYFMGVELGLAQDDVLAMMESVKLTEVEPLQENFSGNMEIRYAFEDESKEAYFDLEFAEGILIKKMYHIPFSINVDSGFEPNKRIYDALHQKMKDGEVNNLNEVEAYFGSSYLFSEALADIADPDAGLKRTYRWRGGTHNIDVFTDETDTLIGFKIGSSAIPE